MTVASLKSTLIGLDARTERAAEPAGCNSSASFSIDLFPGPSTLQRPSWPGQSLPWWVGNLRSDLKSGPHLICIPLPSRSTTSLDVRTVTTGRFPMRARIWNYDRWGQRRTHSRSGAATGRHKSSPLGDLGMHVYGAGRRSAGYNLRQC